MSSEKDIRLTRKNDISQTKGSDIRLTKLASCAGCGAKVGAGVLAKLLGGLPVRKDENLLVGFDTSDDASVYRIDDNTAVINTLDFFPPIADDPFLFGQIAAANALSDVYAMGGRPVVALNIMTVTKEMPDEMIHEILRGGYDKVYEAGALIAGGHTIEDTEPKYGLAVTGIARPDAILRNNTAKEGDVLILTKPLGVGILTTAMKADMVGEETIARVYEQMRTLNRKAAECMAGLEVHACTDVTGFSLLGHSLEMAMGSGVDIHLEPEKIKYHPEAYEMAQMGFVPAGAYRNRAFAEPHLVLGKEVTRAQADILFDPQTSGGLLIAVAEKDAGKLLERLEGAMEGVSQAGEVRGHDAGSDKYLFCG